MDNAIIAVKKYNPKQLFSVKYLYGKEFPVLNFLVPGLLPSGVNLVVGKPKTGKTNFVTNLALALSYEGEFLGQKVEKANVLLLNLEDGERRLQHRLKTITGDKPAPENFDYVCAASGIDGILLIDKWLAKQEGRSLVIVDTLAKFRGMMKYNQNLYEYDYNSLQLFRELAEKYQATFLVVHHSRKAESEDVLDCVSGSLGLSGAADNVFILKKARGKSDVELHVVGRDLEDQKLALKYNYPPPFGFLKLLPKQHLTIEH